MPTYRLSEIADLLKATLKGDPNCEIVGIAPLDHAKQGHISFLYHSKYRHSLPTTQASAVILSPKESDHCLVSAVLVDNPHIAYAKVANLFAPKLIAVSGIHPTAIIGENCQIAKSASIGAHCVIGDGVVIGENTILKPGCIIEENCKIAEDGLLYAHVTLYHQVQIGQRAIIHSSAVIGADGFGFASDGKSWHKIPQVGSVVIGDDVEIGANTTIDRGALGNTIIENGVKLDNQIQIAHNVQIGENTIIAGCTVIGGSTQIGKNCMMGGSVTVADNLKITDKVILVGTAVVEKSIDEPGIYGSGTGIFPFRELKKLIARFGQLDDFARRLKILEKQNECH